MSDQQQSESHRREIGGLASRTADLRSAAALPDADSRELLDAALTELELAVSALAALDTDQASERSKVTGSESERKLLRTVFQDVPVPLFLLERDGTVRRVNRQAGALLGASTGYLAGKPFPVFCDLTTRAAVRSHLAGVFRSGRRRHGRVRFLARSGPLDADATFARIWVTGEPEPLVVVATSPSMADPAEQGQPREATTADDVVATLVHRMDVLATATGALLEDESLTESVAVRRCARLLASELADWVLIDLEGDDELLRQVVIGPVDEQSAEIARRLEEVHPAPGTLPASVHASGQAALHAHVDDMDLLGVGPDGPPVAGVIGAATLMCVPLFDGSRCLGTLTLAGGGEQGPFDLMDLGLAERVARNLALVIRMGRRFRRRAVVADRLQTSLLPRELPSVPGVELAGRYVGATRGVEIGGDFYDVFPAGSGGWGLVIGDVCGKGEDAAAVTATARHGIRLLARWNTKPTEVLRMVNEALLEQERFVTAVMACLETGEESVSVTLGSAGHPPGTLILRDGRIRALSGGGMPLGLFDEDFEIGTEQLVLTPGDTLFLHSDGVLDALNDQRERFGTDRLIETLAAHGDRPLEDLVGSVVQTLLDFCDGDLRDDLSLLSLRVAPGTDRPRSG